MGSNLIYIECDHSGWDIIDGEFCTPDSGIKKRVKLDRLPDGNPTPPADGFTCPLGRKCGHPCRETIIVPNEFRVTVKLVG